MKMRGEIGDFENAISADDFIVALKEHAGADLTIELDSPGGSVMDGLSIASAIMRHEGTVTVVVDTLCASIATVIACAAGKVIMRSGSKYMIHRCWTVAMGNANDFRSTADVMEMLDKDISKTYTDKTGIDSDEIIGMMDAETWFTAEEALALGFADDIEVVERKKLEAKAEIKPLAVSPVAIAAKAGAVARRMRLRLSK